MGELVRLPSERRRHPRLQGFDLIAEIRGKRYGVLDISFGGMRIEGKFTVAGGLVDAVILPGKEQSTPLQAEVRGRVERVDGERTAVRFSNCSTALARLIDGK